MKSLEKTLRAQTPRMRFNIMPVLLSGLVAGLMPLLAAESAHAADAKNPPVVDLATLVPVNPTFTEIFCEFRPSGTTLNCSFSSKGKNRLALSDKDISTFIDKAGTEAFINVKSRAGFERTFLVDAKHPMLEHIDVLRKSGSASELGRAKSDLYAEIEHHVIDLSNNLDSEAKKQVLVKSDPAVGTQRSRLVLTNMSNELDDLRRTCSITDGSDGKKRERVCYSTAEAKALVDDNKTLTTYMTDILNAMQAQNSCLGDKRVHVEADGSVDMAQVTNLAKAFSERCVGGKYKAAASAVNCPTVPAASAPSVKSSDDYFAILLASNHGKPETDPGASCSASYVGGPEIVSAQSATSTPLCVGQIKCGGETHTIACEASAAGKLVYCPSAKNCLASGKVNVWTKNVRVAE